MSKGNYEYIRKWFEFVWENPDITTANHTALFMWLIELNNRLGWVDKFQITSTQNMLSMSCKTFKTYSKCLSDLIEWNFINLIKKSKNQYQCNVVGLVKISEALTKAPTKALTKALLQHQLEQSQSTIDSTIQSNDSILKPKTTNLKPKTTNIPKFDFLKSMIDLGFEPKLVDEWLLVRKNKKATNSETALTGFMAEVSNSGLPKNEVLAECVKRSWSGFKTEWLNNNSKNGGTKKGSAAVIPDGQTFGKL